jgi:hypothetical protein
LAPSFFSSISFALAGLEFRDRPAEGRRDRLHGHRVLDVDQADLGCEFRIPEVGIGLRGGLDLLGIVKDHARGEVLRDHVLALDALDDLARTLDLAVVDLLQNTVLVELVPACVTHARHVHGAARQRALGSPP